MDFTDEEMELLKKSPYIENVLRTRLTYGKLFYQEYWRIRELGYTAREAFDFLGVDPDIVGEARIRKVNTRVKEMVRKNELYENGSEGTLSIAQQLKQKENQIKRLEQEVEFLKKKKMLDWKYKT
jgi:hypothetical protein